MAPSGPKPLGALVSQASARPAASLRPGLAETTLRVEDKTSQRNIVRGVIAGLERQRPVRTEGSLLACAARECHPGRFTLYPCHYNTAFACSLIPSTLSYRLALRSAFPHVGHEGGQRRYFVHLLNRRVRVVPIGRQRGIRDRGTLKPLFLAAYLLVQACQHLMRPCWLVEHHGLYQHLL